MVYASKESGIRHRNETGMDSTLAENIRLSVDKYYINNYHLRRFPQVLDRRNHTLAHPIIRSLADEILHGRKLVVLAGAGLSMATPTEMDGGAEVAARVVAEI